MNYNIKILSLLLISYCSVSNANATPNDLLPPNAKAGECYARVFVPATFETKTEDVVVQQASEKIKVLPAEFEWAEEKVVVQEASTKLEVVPATFKDVQEKIQVRAASKKIVEIPAKYEVISEQVIDKPAHTIWKPGRGPVERVNHGTGEIMCLVEVPATYKTVTKRIVKSPASINEIEIPAEYRTVTKRVVDQPASTREIQIPAKYELVKIQKLLRPAREIREQIPQKSETITRTIKSSEGQMDWQRVLCETNMTPEIVKPMQVALKDGGYYAGPIDGSVGNATLRAIKSYQTKNGLVEGGLTLETISHLQQNNKDESVRAQLKRGLNQ